MGTAALSTGADPGSFPLNKSAAPTAAAATAEPTATPNTPLDLRSDHTPLLGGGQLFDSPSTLPGNDLCAGAVGFVFASVADGVGVGCRDPAPSPDPTKLSTTRSTGVQHSSPSHHARASRRTSPLSNAAHSSKVLIGTSTPPVSTHHSGRPELAIDSIGVPSLTSVSANERIPDTIDPRPVASVCR